jgi:hypothetical protein
MSQDSSEEDGATRELSRHPLVPRDKLDVEGARSAVRAGYPAVAPVLPGLLEWVQDGKWPVAGIIAPFLAKIGMPILPEVQRVLESADDVWKYWLLKLVVAESPEVLNALRPTLTRLVQNPTVGEQVEGVVAAARKLLEKSA